MDTFIDLLRVVDWPFVALIAIGSIRRCYALTILHLAEKEVK